jgi:hypothetical protein
MKSCSKCGICCIKEPCPVAVGLGVPKQVRPCPFMGINKNDGSAEPTYCKLAMLIQKRDGNMTLACQSASAS